MKTKKPNYGQELIPFLWISLISIVLLLSIIGYLVFSGTNHTTAITAMGSVALFLAALSAMSLWSSRVGKLIMRDKLIQAIALKGDETILDVGCGKGLLTVGIAKKLTTGKVFGLDHWQGTFEYTYTRDMAINNVSIEGVGARTEIVNGDAKQLPFDENTFDLITSSLALHHVGDGNIAFREMMRVLKPGGMIAIADMPTAKIKRQMQEEGFEIVLIKSLVRLFFIKVHLIIAKKK